MDDVRSVRMDEETRNEFLGTGGTGVVSFAPDEAGEAPFSLPVSYGYDAESGDFYFRLATGPDAGKADFVDRRTPVSFVAYETLDGRWESVVATGRLEEVTEAAIDSDVVQAMRNVEIPLVDVFDRHPREVEFGFYRLVPEEVTGKREARTED
ncbi:pyridoxamine 5'-phosphate oxidase family protein [Halobium salinum]|uniref:Pyridoxamine 5'-phosphate oxidase family protein n=1 Tax=Halobium salinum TaxID=1364940 RepID=A0ABD5P8E3_9EURY|nr:pyridoxamine 5'-phosphate oxidase family protein [Halobium salinum]